mmetsp:Transcript_11075/g.16837  ORF Transcript_11075/g.16837 Transcript_11075/m.16837 type:complete len:99 (-) Transcript_11075:1550-1846(-)
MASCTCFSVSVSSAEVASSKHIILVFFRRALAMATRYFSPPESLRPLSPASSMYCLFLVMMKGWNCAFWEAGVIFLISSSLLEGLSTNFLNSGSFTPP